MVLKGLANQENKRMIRVFSKGDAISSAEVVGKSCLTERSDETTASGQYYKMTLTK